MAKRIVKNSKESRQLQVSNVFCNQSKLGSFLVMKNILIKLILIKFPTFQFFFIFQGLLHIIKFQKVFIPRITLTQPAFIFNLQNNYLYTQQPLAFILQKIFITLTTILMVYFFFFCRKISISLTGLLALLVFFFFRKILELFTNFFWKLFFVFF